jgi:hypothetical protein
MNRIFATQASLLTSIVALLTAATASCQVSDPKSAARNAELNRPAAPEMSRICALHGDERETELRKLKDLTGLELYCPDGS